MLLSRRVRVICRSSLLALTTSPPLIKYQQTTPPKQGIRRKPFTLICCYLTCSSNNWINSHFFHTHAQRIGCECPILFLTRAKQGTREEALLSHGRTLSYWLFGINGLPGRVGRSTSSCLGKVYSFIGKWSTPPIRIEAEEVGKAKKVDLKF